MGTLTFLSFIEARIKKALLHVFAMMGAAADLQFL